MNGELTEIFRISLKATHQEALVFICCTVLIFLSILAFQYCFSKFLSHVLWVSWLHCFINNYPRGWGFSMIYLPQGLGFGTLCPGVENLLFPKILVRLGIDWYITEERDCVEVPDKAIYLDRRLREEIIHSKTIFQCWNPTVDWPKPEAHNPFRSISGTVCVFVPRCGNLNGQDSCILTN